MARPARRSVPEQLILVVLVCASVSAFGFSYKTPAWFLLPPCMISLLWRIKRLPPGLRGWARYGAWVWLGGTVVLGLIFMAYPVLSQQTATRLSLFAGYGLASFSALFLLGTLVWPPASTLFPVTLGTLVVACFNPAGRFSGSLVVAGTAVFAYLALSNWESATPKRPALGQLIRLAFSAFGIFLVASAIIRLLPWAQGRVEQATFGFFSPQAVHYSGLSFQSRLGDLKQLKLSKKVVMRVWSSRPQKLRGRVFTQFDGQTWRARRYASIRLMPAPLSFPVSESMSEWLNTMPGPPLHDSGIRCETGRAAPEYPHQNSSNHLQQRLAGFSRAKAAGPRAAHRSPYGHS